MKKISTIAFNALPVIVMIGLIPVITNDYLLASAYAAITIVFLFFSYQKHDLLVLAFGFVALTISELLFVATGVETFTRNSLFGILPIWLPFLWAYAFVAIKRSLIALTRSI